MSDQNRTVSVFKIRKRTNKRKKECQGMRK